jgi:hypothetical protein
MTAVSRPPLDDIVIAARTRCPVLITGTAVEALAIARMIAARSRAGNDVHMWNVATAGAGELFDPANHVGHGCIVLLADIDRLSPVQQRWVSLLLEDAECPLPRIVASSAVALWPRVRGGRFSAELFYRINAIQISAADMR